MNVCFFDRAALEKRLNMSDVLDVVEGVYRSKASGNTVVWPTVTHHFDDRSAVMDIRSGYDRGSEVYGAKILGTFPQNEALGLPPFSGILVAMDGKKPACPRASWMRPTSPPCAPARRRPSAPERSPGRSPTRCSFSARAASPSS
ncbi:MAG: hypothetical protein II420_05160 [Oscillospiraceae bacterium]|nr:hypothetical protein [Oscillospiraceae bacterium]